MDLKKPEYFENRELSWIKFDERVLGEAKDSKIPLLERLKFISITSSNLDEFFMVRVASLKDMVHAKYKKADFSGLTPAMQLERINKATRELVKSQYSTYNRMLIPLLKEEGIFVLDDYNQLSENQKIEMDKYFDEVIYPVVTPMAVDSGRPFPLILNKTLNIAALIEKESDKDDLEKLSKDKKNEKLFATVQVPSVLPRLVPVTPEKGEGQDYCFILLEQIIIKNINKLFSNHIVKCTAPYRVMRNADLSIEEEEAHDLLVEIENKLKKRQWGEVIRLEVDDEIDSRLLEILKEKLIVDSEDVFKISGPLDLTYAIKLFGLEGKDNLRYEPYVPQKHPAFLEEKNIFDIIKEGDVLMHHPYQSFDPVVELISRAAEDEDVLAIKMTLYRVSGNSPIIKALAKAAENGKQVTVLVELKARFDEEHNIVWARMLEKAGCHVLYGLVGLKTHSKISLVVRKEEEGIRRYVHLGTGNYNDSTAKLYTDLGLFTCSEAIGEDATAVFNMLSGYSEPTGWNHLAVAPIWLRKKFIKLIKRETKHALDGKKAKITAKMNSLCDEGIIEALYEASAAGVQIDLIVRGICCLKTGISGVSENIRVRSIVGNFLEHSRIFVFYNNGNEEVYMGSADWMPRNLDRRVEILFPVLDEKLKEEVMHIIELELADNVKASVLNAEGIYEKIDKRGKELINSQNIFCEEAIALAKVDDVSANKRVFVPIEKRD